MGEGGWGGGGGGRGTVWDLRMGDGEACALLLERKTGEGRAESHTWNHVWPPHTRPVTPFWARPKTCGVNFEIVKKSNIWDNGLPSATSEDTDTRAHAQARTHASTHGTYEYCREFCREYCREYCRGFCRGYCRENCRGFCREYCRGFCVNFS